MYTVPTTICQASNHGHRKETRNTLPYMVVGSGIHKKEKFRSASSATNTKSIGYGETQQLGNIIFETKMYNPLDKIWSTGAALKFI